MDHEAIKDKLFLYKDPETPVGAKREIEAHLETCASCREVFSRWEQIQARLSEARLSDSATFAYRVMERLEEKTQPVLAGNLLPDFLKWLFPAFGYSVAIVLMFIVIVHRQMPVNPEAILLADIPQTTQWGFADQDPDAENLIGM